MHNVQLLRDVMPVRGLNVPAGHHSGEPTPPTQNAPTGQSLLSIVPFPPLSFCEPAGQ